MDIGGNYPNAMDMAAPWPDQTLLRMALKNYLGQPDTYNVPLKKYPLSEGFVSRQDFRSS